ncbi:HAMP domain-containing protein [Bacillus sp. BRMEA1]|uniref:sensor histidine kinase n=1 Tax=Neobacillus endophyticus TaxID=2738405 RepID=UPI00156787C0|nr:ATP-binding protein [Neobacillus endophyticus]NRD79173.1 HAMP domain-containing protein [Neobacillus endophyticus]
MIKPFKKLLFPRSLRYQLLTRTLFILAFILLVIGLVQYWVMKGFLYQNEAETLNAKLMSLPRDIALNTDSGYFNRKPDIHTDDNQPTENHFFFLQDMSLALVDKDGNYTDLLGSTSMKAPKLSKNEYKSISEDFSKHQKVPYQIVKNSKGVEQLIVFKPTGGGKPDEILKQSPSFLQLGTNTASLQNILLRQLLTFIILSVVALAAGLMIYLRVLKKTLVPLSKIVSAVKKTNAGNLADRLPEGQGQEEIDHLSRSFNAMLERLEKSFEDERETKEQMRRFIADASHELRTPLTSINGFVEVLLRGAANRPEQLYKALNSMHGETKRIIKLVEDLLFLTKLDQAPALQLSETNLSSLLKEMEPQLSVLAGNRTIQFELLEPMVGLYETNKIKQVILNLFNNAVQHTDSNTGEIKISLSKMEQKAVLSIQDNGPGIGKESLPHIFDRFYRADASRTRLYGGAGLGLAITKSIVEAHKGKIEVDSQLGKGATFRVYLPLG